MDDVPPDWRGVSLGAAATWYSGGTPRTTSPEYWGGTIPWISAASLDDFHVSESNRRVTELGAASGTRLVPEGTVLFVVRGMSLKSEFKIGITRRVVAFGQDCKALIPRPNIDGLFLAYAIKAQSEQVLDMVDEAGHGTGRLVTDRLQQLTVGVPPPTEQQAIAEVLGALDDKIEANTRLVALLRDLARAQLLHAADLTNRLVVGDVADVRKGLSYTGAGLSDAGMPMVNLANAGPFGWLKRSGFKHYTGPYKQRHVAPKGALFVSGVDLTWKLEIIGWPMLLPDDVEPSLFSQDMFLFDFRADRQWLRLPLWAHLYSAGARAWIEGVAYGTTVARVPSEALTRLEFLAPPAHHPVLSLAADLLRGAWAAERESAALTQLRDTLLPPLLSGKLRVRNAKELVAEAGT